MWPFGKRSTGSTVELWKGFTDIHSHLLPGVDDGAASMPVTLALLEQYAQAGVEAVCMTPHVMEDIPNTTERLRSVFQNVCGQYHGGLKLLLAAEYMLDSLLEERLESQDLLALGSNHLLVECSVFQAPRNLEALLEGVCRAGYFPVLAHPERYMYMDMAMYGCLKKNRIQFQLNLPSVIGLYGTKVRKRALRLLREGMYDYVGTDVHSRKMWDFLTRTDELGRMAARLLPLMENNKKLMGLK